MGGGDLDPPDPPPGSATVHRPGIGYGYRANYGSKNVFFISMPNEKERKRNMRIRNAF